MSVEEQVTQFELDIGMRVSSEESAMKLLRESMLARGIDPDSGAPDIEIKPEWRKLKGDDLTDWAGWEDAALDIQL